MLMTEQELSERIKQLEHKLETQRLREPLFTKHRLKLFIVLIVIMIALASLIFYASTNNQSSTARNSLPITSETAGFNVYYFNGAIPGGFELDEQSVSSQNEVLLFRLVNKDDGKEIAVTQQSTGEYDYTQLRGDKEFRTPAGQAFITDGQMRTTGALFTDDGTWILLNAASPIGADIMTQIISNLSKESQ